MRVEILTIGTELLLGEIVDTNTKTLARAMRPLGIDLLRSSTVGDNAERISAAVQESLARADLVITSGGLGPTVDDATREGIAGALALPLEYKPELWGQIMARFARFGARPTENNRRQAMIPKGSMALENPVGTAPAFIMEGEDGTVIALPGVPAELEALLQGAVLPYLKERFNLHAIIRTRILRTAGVGESWLDSQIGDLEHLQNPTVGLAAHPGQVDIRITAKASDETRAIELIEEIESNLRERLGDVVYGTDEDTLADILRQGLSARSWRLFAAESGTGGQLAAALEGLDRSFVAGVVLPKAIDREALRGALRVGLQTYDAHVGVGLALTTGHNRQALSAILHLPEPDGEEELERTYGGPPEYAPGWAVSLGLDLLRRRLKTS